MFGWHASGVFLALLFLFAFVMGVVSVVISVVLGDFGVIVLL